MHVFSTKLDETTRTIELVLGQDLGPLAAAIEGGVSKTTVAVGSGGSAISAEYLGLCRRTLGSAPTLVQTPMEFVLADGSLVDSDVFLFSAGGNNPDILAALETAIARGARALRVVTSNRAGELARTCADLPYTKLYVLPTADTKDGFLATHSVASSITAILVATDLASKSDRSASLGQDFLAAAEGVLAADSREAMAQCFASLRKTDTIVLLEDPRLSTVGLLIETSVWETALCSIQRTDHRNFAHGRHVWLQHRSDDAFIISIVGPESIGIWKAIEELVPENVRRLCLDVKNCGRFENAVGMLRGLTIVEALGKATAIDPAKPGVGPFAGEIYDSRLLLDLTEVLPSAVRHKRAAMAKADLADAGSLSLIESFDCLRARLRTARFRGLILDYDGTVVSAAGRFDPPTRAVIEEIERLLDGGMRLAFATGRGGSAAEKLREVIPVKFHPDILVGYYNGADIRTLDVDIRTSPLPPAAVIIEVGEWIDENSDLFVLEPKLRRSSVQVTIELAGISDVAEFHRRFTRRFGSNLEVRMARSAHTIDVCLSRTCKTNVFRQLAGTGGGIPPESILCVGDSGDALGNDYALLGMPFGLSVDQVCCRPEAGWALFGAALTGPGALLHILRALRSEPEGGFKIDVDALC
jgi:hydroxymethylpyrimidine pyrophosphatase-like HAD family hydrolase